MRQTGKAVIPIEICQVPAGQILRKQLPSDKTSDVIRFATKKPEDRLNSIKSGLAVSACLMLWDCALIAKMYAGVVLRVIGIRPSIRHGSRFRAHEDQCSRAATSDSQVRPKEQGTDHCT